MKEKFSKSSAISSVICALTLFLSYELAPDNPEGTIVIMLQVLFFTSIITGILSLIFSIMAHKRKESGFLKNIAPLILIMILLIIALSIAGIIVSFM
ncbi:hypothetical protein D3H55_05085 [Bacillus salacetis]|uniref:Uncharacterized protein n=1 Tax=Bacillus salacetis TaxID=2315464 RepID=A0A3A1R7C3_9BACI|nr:hypothetical protein [Bacillus salacetis]RIW37411.1 hypothetical protein D3H55_05085 [Bacillus salacetis]